MKQLIVLAFLFFLTPLSSYSDDDPVICQMDMATPDQNPIPNYLQSWWGTVQKGKFAVLYVDFPDGRYINGGDTLQPFYDWQLEWVRDHGVIDAAGEMGLVLDPTNIQAGSKYVKASKYSWYDRWNMFFDSLGVYYGSAHPDFVSNGDSAWGSLKQYWKEASNGKFDLIPYETHPSESNYKLRTGIINDYVLVNGIPVIKCLKLPFKKYGTSDANSYFRRYTAGGDTSETIALRMISDATNLINSTTDFNLAEFYQNGGSLFIYFAGSHGSLKDVGILSPKVSMVVARENPITDQESRIDGIGVSAHQYGHIEFKPSPSQTPVWEGRDFGSL